MTIGTNYIKDLTPINCLGAWGHTTLQEFGCTIFDTAGGAFTLESVTCEITDPAGAVTTETVHNGIAFQGAWAAGSTYNAVSGVLVMLRAAGHADGTKLRFKVQSTDGANSAYLSWDVGIGPSPESTGHPVLDDIVRKPSARGNLWKIIEVVGPVGSQRFKLQSLSRAISGHILARADEVELVGPRDRALAGDIMVEE